MEPYSQDEQQKKTKRYVTISFAVHMAGLLALGVGSFFAPQTLQLMPSVQIDMVALPDRVKNQAQEPVDTSLPVKEKPVPPKPEEKAEEKHDDKKDLVLEKKREEVREKEAEKRAKDALAKIREQLKKEQQAAEAKKKEALEKRKEDLKRFEQTYRNALKGNETNQGSSITGQMQSVMNAYAGHVTDRIRSNWALPSFLQNQQLSARVIIYIAADGRLLKMAFTKLSGNSLFDNNVETAVKRSSPFFPPPAEMASGLRNGGIEVKFPL